VPHGDAIVVCPEPLAAAAGAQVLREGGNAVDAAIAAAYVQGVVNPLMCGIGGTGRLLVHWRGTGETVLANFGTRAGSRAHEHVFPDIEPTVFANRFRAKEWENYVGYKAVAIPSFVRGTFDAHQRWGTASWDALLAPAIDLCERGFPVDTFAYSFWDPARERHRDSPDPQVTLTATEECAGIYLKADGAVYEVGDLLVQRDYGVTLRIIASDGADAFYRGRLARAIAADFDEHGALVTTEDLRRCRTDFEQPVRGRFYGHDVVTEGSPSMGSLEIEALHVLEALAIDADLRPSATYYGTLANVFAVMYHDRALHNADPRFVEVPERDFLSRDRAGRIAKGLRAYDGAPAPVAQVHGAAHSSQDTTHVSVVDGHGNAAAMTHSNGNSAGVVTPGLGFLYNHHMHNFDPRPGQRDSIAAGKRPLFGCSPLMLLRDGAPVVVSGSKSRYRVTAEIQVLMDHVVYGRSLNDAIAAPRIHAEYAPATAYLEPELDTQTRADLETLAWRCRTVDMAVPMCTISRSRGTTWEAVADPRGGGGLATA
jgi:gamma-glutamyltranspeptidase / glutathione hydrolase